MKKGVLIAVLIAILIVVSALALSGAVFDFEILIAKFINPGASKSIIVRIFTEVGEYYGVIAVVAILLLHRSRKKIGFPVAVAVIVSWLSNTVIKNLIRRERPAERLMEVSGYSFPSGHAMNNAALYVAIFILLRRLCKTKVQKNLTYLILILPIFIGLSRIYFNVHYSTDVICGWILGTLTAVLVCCNKYVHNTSKGDA